MKNEEDDNKELPVMIFYCNCGPFHFLCNNDDGEDENESNELALC